MKKLLVLLTLFSQHDGAACGRPIILQRIVGGEDSEIGKWPWQISLQMGGSPVCGGTLVANSWVLTAAHCFVKPINTKHYTMYFGVHQLLGLQQPGIEVRAAKKIIIHPDFTDEGSGRDIALVQLEKPIDFTPSILPICLPSASMNLSEGTTCWATGWGEVNDGEPLAKPKTLQEVQLALIDNKNCESMYQTSLGYNPNFKLIKNDMMCAGYKEGKKDTCQGDSGGPLVCSVNGVWVQMGIISWGVGCAEPSQPGIYTSVQYYLPWIQTFVTSLEKIDDLENVYLVQKVDTSPNNSNHSDILFDPNYVESGNSTEPKMQFLVGNGAPMNLWSMTNSMLILLGLMLHL
ncbi:serine protease 27-like [Hyla sarda]|uniref:serine protease 27-like n=1 Tax=Hyla sarda TaxID=327740 RepID=UPI0024C319AA|nr:serine protease 27-like [Hyla sarda]